METKGGFYITQIKHLQERIFDKLLIEYGLDICRLSLRTENSSRFQIQLKCLTLGWIINSFVSRTEKYSFPL